MAVGIRKKIGQILIDSGAITAEQLQTALGMAKGAGKRIGEMLVEAGMCDDEAIAKALAKQFQMRYIDLSDQGVVDRIDVGQLPKDLVRKHLILPLGKENGKIQVIIHDPRNIELIDMVQFRLSAKVEPSIAPRSRIKEFIDNKLGGADGAPGGGGGLSRESLISASIDKSLDKSVDRSVDSSIDQAAESAPIIRLVEKIIIEAVKGRASDIHIEPMSDRVRLRYRIDGVCVERDNLPKRMQNAVLARFKLMSSMNIAEKRVPQDGRIKMPVPQDDGQEQIVDFRVSACPAYHGESVVLRILRPDSVRIGLVNLGFEPDNLAIFNRIIRRPNGIFLVTGPTGSGKTTTLYSALDVLNRPDKKIITAEDPIEYAFTGINQCQVRESIGLTFSNILRAMLRQAPNIILVGEIRDKEVGEVAIQAALTGHLVFSTLHTNDAPSAMTRLTDMGIKPFLVASSIQAVLAQRLIRILDAKSKQPDPNPDPKFLRLVGISPEERERHTIYRAVPNADNNGYKGRQGIFELMEMNAELRDLAFKCAPLNRLREAALASGMRPLLGDGKIKILKGTTTPAEIARVAQVAGVAMDSVEEEEEASAAAQEAEL
ncbi:MAG: Flp pilus assembly complex ATPase component TadA [Phycisphaerales bacterium]|nr:Flp pilus assembly complex ATPase component TadA [Phycisphaerales bacterium]